MVQKDPADDRYTQVQPVIVLVRTEAVGVRTAWREEGECREHVTDAEPRREAGRIGARYIAVAERST